MKEGPRTASSQCSGGQCWGSTPNFECETLGPGQCQTWVMGGGDMPFSTAMKDMKEHGEFLPVALIDKPSPAMLKAGIKAGDLLTHINDQNPRSVADWGVLLFCLPAGTELRVIKPDGTALEVTLK